MQFIAPDDCQLPSAGLGDGRRSFRSLIGGTSEDTSTFICESSTRDTSAPRSELGHRACDNMGLPGTTGRAVAFCWRCIPTKSVEPSMLQGKPVVRPGAQHNCSRNPAWLLLRKGCEAS